MNIRTLLLTIILAGLCASAQAQWYVDLDNTSGTEDGTSWATAFTTIQPAIDAAFAEVAVNTAELSGDVWIAEGVYDERRFSAGIDGRDINTGSVVMKPGVDIYGGFSGSETVRSDRDWETHVTVIDGSTARDGRGATYAVFGADNATIDGFTVRGADSFAVDLANGAGGGMFNLGTSPVVSNCIFTENAASTGGGMGNFAGASPVVANCTFYGNSARTLGGGMYNLGSSPTVIDCIFGQNTSAEGNGMLNLNASTTVVDSTFTEHSGSAVTNRGGTPTLIGCLIFNNGVGVFSRLNSSQTFVNCVITRNDRGLNIDHSSATLVNCTVTENLSDNPDPRWADGILFVASSLTLTNCIVWGNGLDWEEGGSGSSFIVTYSNIGRGFNGGGEGNISADPLFVNSVAGDLRLRAGSPSIDTGTAVGAPEDDLLGTSRPQGVGVDMGAYEFPVEDDADGDGIPDAIEGDGDADGDQIPNREDLDSDNDGLLDVDEGITDPDGDGLGNFVDTDSDGDGFDDDLEVLLGLATYVSDDPEGDPDEDGLTTWDEAFVHDTLPLNPDTDSDTMPDGWEVENELDPTVDDADDNFDGDDLTNIQELEAETAANDASDPPDDVYVSLDGEDESGKGTLTSPWRTIGFAMDDVDRYNQWHAVAINLTEGTYEEPVTLIDNVTLAGVSRDTTSIRFFDVNEPEHIVVEGAAGAVLRDITVSVQGQLSSVVTLLRISDVSMEVANVILNGNDNLFSIGVLIGGVGSSDSVIRDSTIRRVQFGIQAVDSAAAIARNTFSDIGGNAIFVAQPEEKQSEEVATPRIGEQGHVETTGFNIFRNVQGSFVANASTNPQVMAEMNDWGVYTEEEIAENMIGLVDFMPFVGESLEAGTVAAQLLDASGDPAVIMPPELNPAAEIPLLGLTGVFDDTLGVFFFGDVPEGRHSLVASATGFAPVTRLFSISVDGIAVLSFPFGLVITGATDVDGSGAVDAVDVQLTINGVLGIGIPAGVNTDVNNSGAVDAVDVQLVINAALGVF